jgi:hypothetical protein
MTKADPVPSFILHESFRAHAFSIAYAELIVAKNRVVINGIGRRKSALQNYASTSP